MAPERRRKSVRGPNQRYKTIYSFKYKHEFTAFRSWIKSTKEWQLNKSATNGFDWFYHKPDRSDPENKCKYVDESVQCNAKVKLTFDKDLEDNGTIQYEVRANPEGENHIEQAFVNDLSDLCENAVNTDPKWVIDEQSRRLLKQIGKAVMEKASNELDEWAQLAEEMEQVTLQDDPEGSNPHQHHPASIITVSKNNDLINWDTLLANHSIQMAIVRSSIGVEEDEEFQRNFKAVLNSNIKQLGVYHFFLGGINSPSSNQQFEALEKILASAGFERKKHLLSIAVQTELNTKFTPREYTAKLIMFIGLLLKNGFMRPIIYCNNNSWNVLIDKTIDDKLLSMLPLWIAHFTADPEPRYPSTWFNKGIPWWMWTYTGTGSMEGVINHVAFQERNLNYNVQDGLFKSAV